MSSRGQAHAQPLVFGPPAVRVFGWYHPARKGAERGAGVVVCAPFGYEAICSHRALRHLAERLAAAGFAALRFDYHGTGDSAGDDRDPGRVRAWIASIEAAIEELRRRSGAVDVALFGLRLGATLAIAAAAERGGVDAVIAWSPCASGKAYVRELKALRLLSGQPDASRQGGAPAPRGAGPGDEESAGFVMTAATAQDLSAIDLGKLTARPAPRVLILHREDLAADDRLGRHLGGLGAAIDARRPDGYAAMMQDPHRSVVPTALLDEAIAWLAEGRHVRAKGPSQEVAASPVLEVEGGREEPLAFGKGGRLFGVLAQPTSGAASERPTVILLNPGSVHHVGSNRMWVRMARTWAALGYAVLRMDVGGIGESRPAPGRDENDTYAPTAVADVQAAMDLLHERGHRRFVAAGLCSGAYVAFHVGLASERVVGSVLVNPQTYYWKEGDSLDVTPAATYNATRHYQRALLRMESWQKALRGDVDFRRVAEVMAMRARSVVEAGARVAMRRAGLGPAQDVAEDLRAIVTRGARVFMVFSGGDPGLDHLERHAGAELGPLRAGPRFGLTIIDGPDHTFTPVWTQDRLVDVLTEHLLRHHG